MPPWFVNWSIRVCNETAHKQADEVLGDEMIAFDISLSTGWAARIGKELSFGTENFYDARHDNAILAVRFNSWCAKLIGRCKPLPRLIAIERPFFRGDESRMLAGLVWEAHKVASSFSIERREYSPKTIKKFITGNGNASKQEVINAVKAKGFNVSNDHEADAVALLLLQESK